MEEDLSREKMSGCVTTSARNVCPVTGPSLGRALADLTWMRRARADLVRQIQMWRLKVVQRRMSGALHLSLPVSMATTDGEARGRRRPSWARLVI